MEAGIRHQNKMVQNTPQQITRSLRPIYYLIPFHCLCCRFFVCRNISRQIDGRFVYQLFTVVHSSLHDSCQRDPSSRSAEQWRKCVESHLLHCIGQMSCRWRCGWCRPRASSTWRRGTDHVWVDPTARDNGRSFGPLAHGFFSPFIRSRSR